MAHFTNDFSTEIHIQWKFGLGVNSLYDIVSLQKFAHGTTAQLLWQMQNSVAIN